MKISNLYLKTLILGGLSVVLAGSIGCSGKASNTPTKQVEPKPTTIEQPSEKPEKVESETREMYESQVKELTLKNITQSGQEISEERLSEITQRKLDMFAAQEATFNFDYADGIYRVVFLGTDDAKFHSKPSEFWLGLIEEPERKEFLKPYYDCATELMLNQESDDFKKLVKELKEKNSDYSDHDYNLATAILNCGASGLAGLTDDNRDEYMEFQEYINGILIKAEKNFSSSETVTRSARA